MKKMDNKVSGSRDRFKEAPWYSPEMEVTVGGLGSIGSWLTFMLGRLVNTIYVYDFDVVESHNLSGQLYGRADIDREKAQAVKAIASDYNPSTKIRKRGKFEEDSGVTPVTFSCFDNMLARKHMFESWKQMDNRKLFIDGRLTAEQLWVYSVTPENQEQYSDILVDDDEIEELPCSFKSTTHISSMIASQMTVMFTNWLHNQQIEDIRDLPFEVTYTAPMVMQTKQK